MLLSFIIPAYNCGEYISHCLDSVIAQGLDKDDFEVIVIDDGSIDDTWEKVKRYCDKNENFRLISTPHRGVGKARNDGIRCANGKYILFVDADDRLLPMGMRILFDNYVIPESFPDVVSFHSRTVDRYYCAKKWEDIRYHTVLFKGKLIDLANRCGVGNSVWSQLISRELIMNKHLEFSDHKIGEDMLFMLNLYGIEGVTVLATSLNIYRYCIRDSSAMNNINKEYVLDVFKSLIDLSDRLKELKSNTAISSSVFNKDIDTCKRWAFTRLSSVPLSYDETKKCLKKAECKGLFVIGPDCSAVNVIIYMVSRSAVLFYIFSAGYRKIFLPFIKPYLRRH